MSDKPWEDYLGEKSADRKDDDIKCNNSIRLPNGFIGCLFRLDRKCIGFDKCKFFKEITNE